MCIRDSASSSRMYVNLQKWRWLSLVQTAFAAYFFCKSKVVFTTLLTVLCIFCYYEQTKHSISLWLESCFLTIHFQNVWRLTVACIILNFYTTRRRSFVSLFMITLQFSNSYLPNTWCIMNYVYKLISKVCLLYTSRCV